MAGVPAQEKLLKLGGSLPSSIKVERGRLSATVPAGFLGEMYDVSYAPLDAGNIQGLEFLFNPEAMSPYELLALETSEISVSGTHIWDLYNKGAEEIFSLIEAYIPTLKKLIRTQQLVENSYLTAHRVFHSFVASIAYVSSKYGFEVRDGELSTLVEDVNRYVQKFHLEDKLFPLSNELYTIPFREFNPYQSGVEVIGDLYLQKIPQLIEYLKKGLGKDKIFNLNFLMDMAIKSKMTIELCAKKVQAMLGHLEIFLSETTASILREFFQNASRSEEISRYLFLSVRSTGSFLEQKVVPAFKDLNEELFLVLKDELSKNRDSIAKVEQNIFSKKGQEERVVSIPAVFQNTLKQIMDYSEIPGDEKTKILEDYNKWKLSPNRMAVDDTISKMRRRVAESFWQVYTACFKRHKLDGRPLIKPVEFLFKYGLWDESLVDGGILTSLLENSKEPFKEEEISVYSAYDWLIAVCDQKIPISNSKDGEYTDITLRELAKEQEQKTRKKVEPQEINTLEFRIEYEIDNLVRESAKICNGNFNNYIPILLKEQFSVVDLGQQILSSDKVRRAFLELRKTDFSAFYREVRYRDNDSNINEFIQKEVLPIFILMPGVGLRSLVWQPKERLKETPARIALPAICFTKPDQIMTNVFGFFRWEIVKDILGPSWNDISLLSLTSEYGDYESSYKNSKILDDEMKERIEEDFKKYRTTRDRFIHDYSRWVTIDSQGRPGVNRVVRELFYRQVPFPKAIRARLGNMPAYEQLNDRYLILMRREIAKLKLKYQKYQREDGSLPPELDAYIQFLGR